MILRADGRCEVIPSKIVTRLMKGDRVVSVAVTDLATNKPVALTGTMFVDGSYEGDLMAFAGVPYRVGREARGEYNESFAGVTNPAAGPVGTGVPLRT